MKRILVILLILFCQKAICQTNTYTAFWKVKPNSGITSFSIQRSSDNTNWITTISVPITKDTSYKADFNAFTNNFIRIMATTKDTVWSSPVIQVVAALPIIVSNIKLVPYSNYLILSWRSQNENNLNNYDIERSFDGVNFSDVASVLPSGTGSNYSLTVNRPTITSEKCIFKLFGWCFYKKTYTVIDSRKEIIKISSVGKDGIKNTLQVVTE